MTDPTSRALRLLGLLQSRATWGGDELAAELGVTTRTLRRDVDRLRELGYRVDAAAGVGGGYGLGRGSSVPPLLLDEDEALALTLALTSAEMHGSGGDPEAATRALSKLEAVLPSAARERMRGVRAAVVMGDPGYRSVDPQVLTAATEAVRRRQRLRFGYVAGSQVRSERWVEPYQFIAHQGRWYLWCWDVERADWRSFRLDRMDRPEMSRWEFRRRADAQDGLLRLREAMPVRTYKHRIVVRIHAPLAEVSDGSVSGYGDFEADGDQTRWTTGGDDPRVAAWWLSRLDWDFEVLEDDAVRDAVAEMGRRLVSAARPVETRR